MSRQRELQQKDFKYLWHPFTQTSVWREVDPLVIERGEGVYLYDADGNRYLDGVSAIWCNVHGHSAEPLVEAIKDQAGKLCHSTLLGLSHAPIIELSEKLAEVTPTGLNRFFFSDSGTAAVEASLRMAIEYWYNVGQKQRTTFGSFVDAYHGDTLGAIGVGFSEGFHNKLRSVIVPGRQIPTPSALRSQGVDESEALELSLQKAREFFAKEGHNLAAFIVEPLVQGAAGIRPYPVQLLREIASLCKEYETLLIADEVATGFGKLATMFASQKAEVIPDMLVMGKGLTAGYLPMSAVAVSDKIFSGFTGAIEEGKTFFFGQTFSGNPIAARVALESLKLFEASDLLNRLGVRLEKFSGLLEDHLAHLEQVSEIRRCGIMTGIEIDIEGGVVDHKSLRSVPLKIVAAARSRGVIIRPLGSTIVLMPPLVINEGQLEELVTTTAAAISEVVK